jgi:hypothetical protein
MANDDNPYKSPDTAARELAPERIRTAAWRGARWGAAVGAILPVAIILFGLGAWTYFRLFNPGMIEYMFNGKSLSQQLLEDVLILCQLTGLGALGGAALAAVRARSRLLKVREKQSA